MRLIGVILSLLGICFLVARQVLAGAISGISYGPSGSVVGTFVQALDTDFVIFTPATALSSGSTVSVTFPAGTSLTSANILVTDFTLGQATSGSCTVAGVDTAPTAMAINETNRTIEFTISALSLSKTVLLSDCGLGVVTIKTSALLGANEIRHPTSATTTGTLGIDTSAGSDTGSISNVIFAADSANKLAFTTQPSTTAETNVNLTTQPVVRVQDQYGNVVNSSAQVTLAAVLASDGTTPGNGTLNATTNPVTASVGTASFAGVNYSLAETIKLKATSTGLTQALSVSVTVSDPIPTPTATPTPTPTATPTPTPTATPTPTSSGATNSKSVILVNEPNAGGCGDIKPGKKAPWVYGAITGKNSVKLYFTDSDAPVGKYVLVYGTSSGKYVYGVTNVGGFGVRTYLVNSLLPKTTYYFRILAVNGCATGEWSNEIMAKTNGTVKLANLVLGAKTSCQSTYLVKKGDSLWLISRRLLGKGARYKEIFAGSDRLKIGQELKISCY